MVFTFVLKCASLIVPDSDVMLLQLENPLCPERVFAWGNA